MKTSWVLFRNYISY